MVHHRPSTSSPPPAGAAAAGPRSRGGRPRRPVVLAGVLALLAGLLAATAPGAGAQPLEDTEPRAVEGLRQTPDIPVRSTPLREGAHAHDRPGGPGGGCDKDVDLTSTIEGVTAVDAQDNGFCTNADIDAYAATGSGPPSAGTPFVVQAGGEEGAWTHTDVTSPSNTSIAGQFVWSGGSGKNTYTPDVKAFQQTNNGTTRDYIALSLERLGPNGFCGVVIVDVTDPVNPKVETQIYKNDSSDFWCDVHNTFVEDVDGEGRYAYVTADARNDLRVVDIAGVENMPDTCDIAAGCDREVGQYKASTADNDNYVHDVTVQTHTSGARRAYLSYWDTGLVVLDVTGADTDGLALAELVGPNVIDPAGFLTHHAIASDSGDLVFIQDEFLDTAGDEPVQMFDISSLSSPKYVDGLKLGTDVPANPAHNLEIRPDLFANRLFVGWYKLGLQAWDFDGDPTGGFGGFTRSNPEPRTAILYHQAQTEGDDGAYSGAWGVRLAAIGADTYIFQSDRAFGLIVDQVGTTGGGGGGGEPAGTMHVGDLDGTSADGPGPNWDATVTITVQDEGTNTDAHDSDEGVVAGATVTGTWSDGTTSTCTTDGDGTCSVTDRFHGNKTTSATFTVDNITHDSLGYDPGDNHDEGSDDGDSSDGTTITVTFP